MSRPTVEPVLPYFDWTVNVSWHTGLVVRHLAMNPPTASDVEAVENLVPLCLMSELCPDEVMLFSLNPTTSLASSSIAMTSLSAASARQFRATLSVERPPAVADR